MSVATSRRSIRSASSVWLGGFFVALAVSLFAQDPPAPIFELGFGEHSESIQGGIGDERHFDLELTLTTRDNLTTKGVQGWSTSFGIEGGTLELLTFDGVIASTVWLDDHDDDPLTPPIRRDPWLQDLGRVKSEGGFAVLSLGFHALDPNIQGGVTAMVLSFIEPKTLQPLGSQPIARVRVSTRIGTEDSVIRLWYEDGFRPPDGMQVNNVVTFDGSTMTPILGAISIPVLSEPPRNFKLGDINADGRQDISDPISGLSFLFLGGQAPPCEKSMDLTGDNKLDISDPIFLLNFLFLHTSTPREPYRQCGLDPLSTRLECAEFAPCEP
jgi:hypothetical protein